MIWLRRSVQGLVLLIFLALLAANRPTTGTAPESPVGIFFDLDPLVLVGTWLATRSFADLSLLGLATLLVSVILGRVFCGWFCPFGTLHNMMGSLRRQFRKVRPRVEGYSRWQRAKYFVLVALLLMAVFGAPWFGVLDPFSVLYRSLTVSVLPVCHVMVSAVANAIYMSDPHLGSMHLRDLTEPFYIWWQDSVTGADIRPFQGSGLIFLIFTAALVFNLVRNRFWCRYICPTGALLGLVSWRPILRLVSDSESCNSCGACTMSCPAAAQPEKPDEWLGSECFGCWNCVGSCKNASLDFKFTLPGRGPAQGAIDLGKRRTMAAVAAGAGTLAMMRITPDSQGATNNPKLIRPPGARPEREFLQRCIQCSMCMEACPTGGLQPTWHEAGLEGVWTPMLVPAIGYCEYECHACGQVCPTGAIMPLTIEEKKQVKIGLAFFDTSRCLPYAYGRECIVCEEHCPVKNKAITFELRESKQRDGTVKTLKFPRVDPELCIGCGICETKCVFQDRAAILVTSAGESRNPDNQPLLSGASDSYESFDEEFSDDPYGSQ